MAETVNPSVVAFLVLSRGLGCIDDTATDQEQYEKVVYYYPEDTPLARQLQTANMCEGLIDFSSRFTENEDVDTVVMKDATYGFKKCEADLWLIAAISNNSEVEGTRGVNELGLRQLLHQAYQTYFMQHGDVQSDLRGLDDSGSQNIQQAKVLRKAIRKLNRKLNEIEDDQLHADEDTPLETIEARAQLKRDSLQERRGLEEQLEDLVVNSPIVRLKKRWQALLRWYLQAQDFTNINSLHNLSGIHYHTLDASGFRKVSRVVFSLKEQTKALGLKACTIMCDGAVIWNELDEPTLLALYEFIRLNQNLKTAAAASNRRSSRSKHKSVRSEFASLQQVERPPTIQEDPGDGYHTFQTATRTPSDEAEGWKSEMAAALKPRRFDSAKKARAAEAREDQTTTGFIGNGWAVLDDKFSQLRSLPEVQTAIFSEYCVGAQGIWCPRMYACGSESTTSISDDNPALAFEMSRGLLGRLVLYKLGRLLFIFLMDEGALSEHKPMSPSTSTTPSTDSSAPHGSPRSAREGGVTVRSVQPICTSVRATLGSVMPDINDIILQANADQTDASSGVKLICLNRCNASFQTIDVGGNGMNTFQFPLQASRLAKHIPDHFLTSIGDAMECFEQRNSRDTFTSYCIRASSGDWLFARCLGGRQVFTLISDQSFFQEAYESVINASRRALRGVVF